MDIKKEKMPLNIDTFFHTIRIKIFLMIGRTKCDTLLKVCYFKYIDLYNPGSSQGTLNSD